MSETADAVGVTRQTVSEWLNQHRGFRAELNRRREELWRGLTDRLRALLPKALDVIASELDGKHGLAAAVHVLRACGFYGIGAPDGPTTVEEIKLLERESKADRASRARLASWKQEGTITKLKG